MNIKYQNLENNYVAYYSNGLHFAFVSPNNEQASNLSATKAYLQDAILAFVNKRPMAIYNPNDNPALDLEHTRILLAHFDNDKDLFFQRMENLMDFLNQVEKSLNFESSHFEVVENTPAKASPNLPVVMLVGDKRWQQAPPMISLYTLLIRTCLSHQAGTKWDETLKAIIAGKIKIDNQGDITSLKAAHDLINKIIQVGSRPFFYKKMERNYPNHVSNNLIHSGGIVAMAEKQTKVIIPRWTSPRTNRITARYCRLHKPELFKTYYPEGVPAKKITGEKTKSVRKPAKKKIPSTF